MYIKDPNLYQAFYDLINVKAMIKQDVTRKKLASFSYLNFSHENIRELDGIEACSKLKSLFLIGNDIRNLEPLLSLSNLYSLDLSMNEHIDWSTLSAPLTNLRVLSLRSCKIKDTSFLSKFPNLQHLSLFDNQVEDLKDIVPLKYLESLVVTGNPIEEEELMSYRNVSGVSDVFPFFKLNESI